MTQHSNVPTRQSLNVPTPSPAFWRWFLIFDLVLLCTGVGGKLLRARAWWHVLQSDVATLRALVRDGPEAASPWSPADVLSITHADLRSFQAEFALFLEIAPYLRWLPRHGADVAALPTLVDIALDLTESGALLAQTLDPLLTPYEHAASPQTYTLETTLDLLRDAQPQLAYTARALARVQQARARLDTAQLSPRLAHWIAELDAALPRLQQGVHGALILPQLLGTSEARTYLLLMQNEDELRPAGGFLTGVARVMVEDGRIAHVYFENSAEVTDYQRPYPDPPDPLREIMGLDLWVFHDSNWSPDFPTSARQAVAFYQQRYATPIHGVLALDQEAFRRLMESLEPLAVESYPEPITAGNIIPALRQSRYNPPHPSPREAWEGQHKAFLEDVLTAAIHKVQEQPEQIDFAQLGLALITAFEERHMFAYALKDADMAALLHEAGWDGALYQGAGDYVMGVDANLGYNKVNAYVAESIAYTVDLRDSQQPQATLMLRYQHGGPQTNERCYHFHKPVNFTYAQRMRQCYWDYARVYVPEGSRLISATPNPIPGRMLLTGKGRAGAAEILPNEASKSVFATFFVLPPGQRAETRFVYTLPPDVVEQSGDVVTYRLYIQKQGGKTEVPLSIHLSLPAGFEIEHSAPMPTEQNSSGVTYSVPAKTDVQLEFVYRLP